MHLPFCGCHSHTPARKSHLRFQDKVPCDDAISTQQQNFKGTPSPPMYLTLQGGKSLRKKWGQLVALLKFNFDNVWLKWASKCNIFWKQHIAFITKKATTQVLVILDLYLHRCSIFQMPVFLFQFSICVSWIVQLYPISGYSSLHFTFSIQIATNFYNIPENASQ